ncbi:hypothetical protein GCM10027290_39580 [Micromonospora sonneratiae]|jgi:hypothetical protein|uniref:Peptidase inhibitor family I36 n=1 Tax=Micromonospora sonneratiae TaxID=1184706 RepID=A0ABW3YFS2_9ACTN
MVRKLGRQLAGTALALVTAGAVGGSPAQASPTETLPAGIENQFGTQASCYSGALRSYFQMGGWGGDAGPFRTTSRCRDINVRNDSMYATYACVVFIDQTGNCNYWTYIPARSSWYVVATNVRDGVRFKVRFSNSFFEYDPLISWAAA